MLPDEAIEAIDPDVWQLMKRLEKMGVIQFNTGFLRDVVVRTTPDVAQAEAQRRRMKAERAFADVTRQLDMGDLLTQGGFVAEAQAAYRKAVALAAAVSGYAQGSGELDAAINPVTMEVRVREELMLPPEEALTLQLAVQGLDLPNASASAREFCQARRESIR